MRSTVSAPHPVPEFRASDSAVPTIAARSGVDSALTDANGDLLVPCKGDD